MMPDATTDTPTHLPLPDADLCFYRQIPLGYDVEELLGRLIRESRWRQERISLFGRTHLQPRLVAWHGDDRARYSYSGTLLEPQPWTTPLLALRRRLEQLCACDFNSVLLNYYRDGSDAMGLHADDEPELGPEPVIASLSLGATRRMYFRHRFRRDIDTFTLALPTGSLLLMRGPTQRNWKHGLRRTAAACGPRVNLTFRYVQPVA